MPKRWTENLKAQVIGTIFGEDPPTDEEVEHLRFQMNCRRMFLAAQKEDKKQKKVVDIKLGPRYSE